MKLQGIVSLITISSVLYVAATTVGANNYGIRAIGFIVGVMCGFALLYWLDDNL